MLVGVHNEPMKNAMVNLTEKITIVETRFSMDI